MATGTIENSYKGAILIASSTNTNASWSAKMSQISSAFMALKKYQRAKCFLEYGGRIFENIDTAGIFKTTILATTYLFFNEIFMDLSNQKRILFVISTDGTTRSDETLTQTTNVLNLYMYT